MFIDSNEKCPVCGEHFTENDDIVICPHCGTPHHRDCYNSLGHCFNADKHNTDFEYKGSSDTSDRPADYDNEDNTTSQQSNCCEHDSEKKTFCSNCGKEIDPSAPFCSSCGERQTNAQYREYSPVTNFGFNNAPHSSYENDERTVEDKSIQDVAAVVRTNTAKFIPKFIKNKKLSWNWAGFIFGPYYLFFRKMYKQGILFMALNLIANLVINGIFYENITQYYTSLYDKLSAFYTNPTSELAQQVLQQASQQQELIMPAMLAISGVTLIIHIITALFSDAFYRTKVINVLDKVEENLEQGASFNMMSPMFDGASLSQSDLKALYLGKLGGTSFISPVMAYFALNIITNIISRIL